MRRRFDVQAQPRFGRALVAASHQYACKSSVCVHRLRSDAAQFFYLLVGVLCPENSGTCHEHVSACLCGNRDRFAVHSPIDLDCNIEVAARVASRTRLIFGICDSRNGWPPNPGSTVITRIMSKLLAGRHSCECQYPA